MFSWRSKKNNRISSYLEIWLSSWKRAKIRMNIFSTSQLLVSDLNYQSMISWFHKTNDRLWNSGQFPTLFLLNVHLFLHKNHICWAILCMSAQLTVTDGQSWTTFTNFSNVAPFTTLTFHLCKQVYICIVAVACSILACSTSVLDNPRSYMTISQSLAKVWASLLRSRSSIRRVLVCCGILVIQLASSEIIMENKARYYDWKRQLQTKCNLGPKTIKNLLISPQKYMLWILIRSASVRHF